VGSTAILLDVRDVCTVEEGIRSNGDAKGRVLAFDVCFLGDGIGEGVGKESKLINGSICCVSWDGLAHLDTLKVLDIGWYIFKR